LAPGGLYSGDLPGIECIDHYVIYENDRPHVHSRHGYFPGLALLSNGELICLFSLAEAFEAPNATTRISRSCDAGRSWSLDPQPLYDRRVLPFETSDYLKPTQLHDGSVVAVGYRFHRHDPESPISIAATGGILPGDDIVSHSADGGKTWSVPRLIDRQYPELLEISGPCCELTSGDLVAVASLYRMPDGSSPSGHFGVLLRSSDGGVSWDDSSRFFEVPHASVAPLEPRICEMQPGRLVALVWAYDMLHDRHLPNHVVVSNDDGRSWSLPVDTGNWGQASGLMWLGGDLLLTAHAHRGNDPGLYVRIVDFSTDHWKPLCETVVYGREALTQTRDGQAMPEMFRSLRFGQPSLLRLPDGDVLASHWCIEEGQGKIRTHRLRVTV
jgi:sialidase-1